jgi:hypothetical protein
MEDLLTNPNPWVLTICGGIITTVVGGMILASLQGEKSIHKSLLELMQESMILRIFFLLTAFATGIVSSSFLFKDVPVLQILCIGLLSALTFASMSKL